MIHVFLKIFKIFLKKDKIRFILIFFSLLLVCIILSFYSEKSKTQPVLASIPYSWKLSEKDFFKKADEDFLNLSLHDSLIIFHFKNSKYAKIENGHLSGRDDYSIINYYNDKLSYSDSNYVSIASFQLAVIYLKLDSLDKSKNYFLKLNKEYPFLNYYKSLLFLKLNDSINSEYFLKKTYKQQNKYQTSAAIILVNYLYRQHRYEDIIELFNEEDLEELLSSEDLIYLYYKTLHLFLYFKSVLIKYFYHLKWIHFFGSMLITSIWFFYLISIDFFRSINYRYVFFIFFAGVIGVLINLFLLNFLDELLIKIEHGTFLYYFFYAGLTEELIKILPVIILIILSKEIKNDLSTIVIYSCYCSLGFAFAENLIHFQNNFHNSLFVRCVTALPGHLINTSIIAFGLTYRKKNIAYTIFYFLFLLILSAMLHALYDLTAVDRVLVLFVVLLIFSLNIWMVILNNVINNFKKFHYINFLDFFNTRFVLLLFLFSVLLFRQWQVYKFKSGVLISQQGAETFLLLLFSVFFISHRLFQMDFLNSFHHPFLSKSISGNNRLVSMLHYFASSLHGTIIPRNIVGMHFQIMLLEDGVLLTFSSIITGRKIVLESNKESNVLIKSPRYFLIKVFGYVKSESTTYLLRLNSENSVNFNYPTKVTLFYYNEKLKNAKEINKSNLILYTHTSIKLQGRGEN